VATLLRTNLVTNPRPAGSTAGWAVSSGESITFVANDGGEPCIEALDAAGGGGVYAEASATEARPNPAIGQWVAFGLDVKALDTSTAANMRVVINGYGDGGTVVYASQRSAATPVTTTGFTRIVHAAQVETRSAGGYLRLFAWPTPVASPNNGFRFRKAVIAVADTEAEARAAVQGFFDGSTPDTATLRYDWTAAANASTSTETYLPPALTATWDPERCLVVLVVDGSNWWPAGVTRVRITRKAGDELTVPVRGLEDVTAPGGSVVWSDNEAPTDASVKYTAVAMNDAGASLWATTSTVQTLLPDRLWGAWVKVPGRPEMTVRAKVRTVGDMARETLGGSWDIPGGPTIAQSGAGALAQSAGIGALTTTLELSTYSPGDLAALQRAVRQAPGQVVLIQTGQPEELPSGYYQVQSMSTSNPAGRRSDLQPLRVTTLTLKEAAVPAGPASGWTGTTLGDVRDAFPTLQAIVDAELTLLDLATGAWS